MKHPLLMKDKPFKSITMIKQAFNFSLLGMIVVALLYYVPKPTQTIAEIHYDTKTIELNKTNFNLTTSSNTVFTITLGSGGEQFVFTGTASSPSLSNTWVNLKSSATQRFTQSTASGSALNKWHLTTLTMTYAKQSATVGQTNTIKLNDTNLFSYVSTTNSSSETNLTLHSETHTSNFAYNESITTFTIVPMLVFFVKAITLIYSIDYSSCNV